MENTAAVDAMEAIGDSFAALADCVGRMTGNSGSSDPLRDQADACLDGLAESARADAMLAAVRVHLAAAFAEKAAALAGPATSPGEHTAQEMSVVAEVACVLTVSERTAGALLSESHDLTATLPLTLAALQAGWISWQHARVMVDETSNLDPAGAASLEAHFLDPDAANPAQGCPAGELVPSRFRHKARTWRERHHPVSIEKRHTKSVLDRRLEYAPDRDGMAWLSAYLPADQAAGIWDRTTTAARALQGPDEGRTLTQLRADIAATLLLGGGHEATNAGNVDSAADGVPSARGVPFNHVLSGQVPSPAAQVLITVPVFSLLGLTEEPAVLDGYGPIPASMAGRLLADGAASFRRVLTDPRDGAPLEIGRTSYRIPTAMRQWLRMRDGKCPFPGCSNHSLDNDADHLHAWAAGGTTGITNLGQPCPKHHRLKHTSGWTPTGAGTDKPPGWTSPTGRHYPSEQPDREPPHWPHQILGLPGDQDPSPVTPGQPGPDRDREAALPGDILSGDILPGSSVPGNLLSEDHLPDRPLPEAPFPEWALFLTSENVGA